MGFLLPVVPSLFLHCLPFLFVQRVSSQPFMAEDWTPSCSSSTSSCGEVFGMASVPTVKTNRARRRRVLRPPLFVPGSCMFTICNGAKDI